MKRVYIAGPMTGVPEFNYPAFNALAAELRTEGFHVENPAENPEPVGKTWAGYMRMSIAQMLTCDFVVVLDGWDQSRGARIEVELAVDLGMTVIRAGSNEAIELHAV